MNRYDLRAKIYFFTGILNLCLALPWGIEYGGIGCAMATGTSMLIGNGLVMNYVYKKDIGLNILKFWKQIGRITISVSLCLIIGYEGNHVIQFSSVFVFIFKIVGYTVLYWIIVYFTAMKPEEKEKVRKLKKYLIK